MEEGGGGGRWAGRQGVSVNGMKGKAAVVGGKEQWPKRFKVL